MTIDAKIEEIKEENKISRIKLDNACLLRPSDFMPLYGLDRYLERLDKTKEDYWANKKSSKRLIGLSIYNPIAILGILYSFAYTIKSIIE